MSISDPIADMLTAIRNAAVARKEKIEIPASKFKQRILEIFRDHGYIRGFKLIDDNKQGIFEIYLRYIEGDPAFSEIVRVSKPGRRVYVKLEEIPNVKRGIGIAILSTSKGVMTNKQAKKEQVGGEYICYIY